MRKHVTLLFLLALTCLKGWSQTYSTPGTQTVTIPAGTSSMVIEVWGAGGGGGGYQGNNTFGGGGAGGGYLRTIVTVPSGVTTYSVTVGSGGTGGARGVNGGNGGGVFLHYWNYNYFSHWR